MGTGTILLRNLCHNIEVPRQARVSVKDTIYHVINRANGRVQIFNTEKDYRLFEELLTEAKEMTNMRILAYCIMPNHWHLLLYPHTDTVMKEFMSWLTSTHVRQYRTQSQTVGYGHLYQDRYKSFPTESDAYAQTLVRYIEQNPLRAKLVSKAEDWRWSSLWRREQGSVQEQKLLAPLPFDLPVDYRTRVNEILIKEKLHTIRTSVNKGTPYGSDTWQDGMIETHNLTHTIRGVGRPRKY